MSKENIKTWPERIYLQHGDSPEVPAFHEVYPGNGYSDGVTWCQDRIEAADVEYVRADVAPPVIATWDERLTKSGKRESEWVAIECMEAEIADLRAALGAKHA